MNNKHSLRSLLHTVSISGALLFAHLGSVAFAESLDFDGKQEALRKAEWKVMDILVETYGATDWSQVTERLLANPDDAGNPNIFVIPIALGNGFLNRFEASKDPSDSDQALRYFESVTGQYPLWKERWLTPSVVHALVISVNRVQTHCDQYSALPPVQRRRALILWRKVKAILKEEADYRLTVELPYTPYDSCFTGDTKAEENAWEAALFAAAANFLPDDPQAATWDEKARQLAYDAITRPSDPPDKSGIKTCTVAEDLTLSNHGFSPNPYYTGATLFLLTQGALAYRLADRPIPEEFTHNFQELSEKYDSYLGDDLSWTLPADPEGDGTIFPLVFDSRLEKEAVFRKLSRGYLWKPTPPVAVMGTGTDLWEAVQNSKVVLYYLMGSYLWHFPSKSPCSELRFKMPADGEVQ
jgi:hypothetical protein